MTQVQSSNAVDGCYRPFPVDPLNPSHARTAMHWGKAVFENMTYRITMGDDNTISIKNRHTRENYQAWGDPHMNVDGQHAFDFWGTTTLKLEDGTKLTIETTPSANNPNVTLSSKVTITNGDYGVQISGIDTDKTGTLKINEAKGWGKVLDCAVDDGTVLQRNATCKSFVAVDDSGLVRNVDQTYINETAPFKGGADKLQNQFKDAFRVLGGLLSIRFAGVFLGTLANANRNSSERHAAPTFDAQAQVALHFDLTLSRWQACATTSEQMTARRANEFAASS
ncbi:MAG: DUF1521 domain-containing protein [Burkholderiales bacterium]|nr:DUF1521 domain-containing protein [Burkholderiales bacterium]